MLVLDKRMNLQPIFSDLLMMWCKVEPGSVSWQLLARWHQPRLAPAGTPCTEVRNPLKTPTQNAHSNPSLTNLCQASLCWRLCGSLIISTVHPFCTALHCTPLYPHNPHLISTCLTLHKSCIHSKSEKVCEVWFSATKKLREKCVNLDIKILQQKCVNY